MRVHAILMIGGIGLAVQLALAQPPSTDTCCRRVLLSERHVLVLDHKGLLWRQERGSPSWQAFRPLSGPVQDITAAADTMWVLGDGDVLVGMTAGGAVTTTAKLPEGTWSIAAEPRGVWSAAVSVPGRHLTSFSWVTARGDVHPAGRAMAPLHPAEADVLARTTPSHRMLVDTFQLAADREACAAFFLERNVLLPCEIGATPVRWASRGAELEHLVRAFEAKAKLPPLPVTQVAGVVGCGGSWWVLENVTGFDPKTGDYSRRDRVRRIARDGTLQEDVALGSRVMGLGVLQDRVYALQADGSLNALQPSK